MNPTCPGTFWSGQNGGGCVEVMITEDSVRVRDTKDGGTGPIHVYTHPEWSAFLARRSNIPQSELIILA